VLAVLVAERAGQLLLQGRYLRPAAVQRLRQRRYVAAHGGARMPAADAAACQPQQQHRCHRCCKLQAQMHFMAVVFS
jgi:hypothetical protein